MLREIAAPLDLQQDTLFVCADHGQIDRSGQGPVVLLEPFVLFGASVRPGTYDDVQMVDVAPTLAALLGVNIPTSSQGRVRSEMLTFDSAHLDAIAQATQPQQSAILAAYQSAIGRQVAIEPGDDVADAHQTALQAARAERLPRLLLALFAALVPAVILWRKRGREMAWLLAGAALAIALFHLRYALLDQYTYSPSSVDSPVSSASASRAICGSSGRKRACIRLNASSAPS